MTFQPGQEFRAFALDGTLLPQRITVVGISVTGQLAVRIELEGFEPLWRDVPYDRAKMLLADNLWVPQNNNAD